jgi:hypothetical protein
MDLLNGSGCEDGGTLLSPPLLGERGLPNGSGCDDKGTFHTCDHLCRVGLSRDPPSSMKGWIARDSLP